MPRSRRHFRCKICAQRYTSIDRRRYNTTTHKGLGLKHVKSGLVCTSCNKRVHDGKPITLQTQLPIPRTNNRPHKGLYATTSYKPNQVIALYYGQIKSNNQVTNTDYAWKLSNNEIIDAQKSPSIAKYANPLCQVLLPCKCQTLQHDHLA